MKRPLLWNAKTAMAFSFEVLRPSAAQRASSLVQRVVHRADRARPRVGARVRLSHGLEFPH